MRPQAVRAKEKKSCVLTSETEFYYLIDKKLMEEGFELLETVKKNSAASRRESSFFVQKT